MSQAFTLVMGTWSSQKSPPKEQGYKNNGFFIAFCALLVIVRLTTNIFTFGQYFCCCGNVQLSHRAQQLTSEHNPIQCFVPGS